jgi:hypothetical protein
MRPSLRGSVDWPTSSTAWPASAPREAPLTRGSDSTLMLLMVGWLGWARRVRARRRQRMCQLTAGFSDFAVTVSVLSRLDKATNDARRTRPQDPSPATTAPPHKW